MQTERQLANLRPPIRPGEVLNPKGRNQWSDRAEFRGLARALAEAPAELADPLAEKLANLIVEGAMDGDKALLLELCRWIWRPSR